MHNPLGKRRKQFTYTGHTGCTCFFLATHLGMKAVLGSRSVMKAGLNLKLGYPEGVRPSQVITITVKMGHDLQHPTTDQTPGSS